MKIKVEFEFDEEELGSKWFNQENLCLLLYSDIKTKKELLKVVNFEGPKDEQ